MNNLRPQIATQFAVIVEKLSKLEKCGRYEDALSEVKEIWEDFAVFPSVENFEPQAAAEMLLRCGSLLGFAQRNENDSQQQHSKDILTAARSRFADLANFEKVAECENYLALAFWRTSEFAEAEIWLEESFAHQLPNSNKVRLYSHVIKSLLLLSNKKHSEIVDYCKKVETDFHNYGDAFLNGSFCSNLGISFNELGDSAEALKYLELARFFHQKSQHKVYLGTVENNLAQLHKLERRFAKAHAAIDSGTSVFRKIKDKTHEGFSLDTKAQIFIAERKFAEALKTIEQAIVIMEKSENLGYLVETMMTKSKILLYLDNFSAAVFCLFDAVTIARQQSGEAAAKKLAQDFENAIKEKDAILKEELLAQKRRAVEKFELILPAELAHYTNIQGIWINNPHLEKIGLHQGSLAIVAKEDIQRGDLTAILEKETEEVSCGFYDAYFGIVSLERIDLEPQLFNEDEIKILGKIIGVCDCGKIAGGKMPVEPLKFPV